LKIAYVITRSDVMGGASVHLLDLASSALEAGHEVLIFVGGKGVFVEQAKDKSLECISLSFLKREIHPIYDFLCFFELKSKLKTFKPDIIHLHSSKAGILGRLAAKSLKIPSVFTAHGWAFTEGVSRFKRKLYLKIERYMAKLTNRIITVSDFDRKLALDSNVGDRKKIVSIHNGMPDIQYLPRKKSKSDYVRFIMVARFDHQKDHKKLVDAFSLIKDKNWLLEFVGDGPFYREVYDYVDIKKLGDKVVFSGACNDVSNRLASSDVFCLISNWEGLPLTIIEAMRAGLPIIASSVGGVPETIIQGETGYLVSRGDVSGISASIKTILKSEDERLRLGENGRLYYENDFKFEQMFDKTLNVYKDILGDDK
jgi:glycosyltransferase involved in cell wall biosynthesis